MKELRIKGIKVHNLKNIDISIPLGYITVITGLSGSGKSSLAFDTIYAESSRRFIESLGAFSRIFLPKMPAPQIESVENIPPAIAVRYLPLSRSSRSTVGTSTEVYDYIRLLYANIGITWCDDCGIKIEPADSSFVADKIVESYEGKMALITFPAPVKNRDKKIIQSELILKGFFRIWRDEKIVEVIKLRSRKNEEFLNVITDRLVLKEKEKTRISEAVVNAYREGDGICSIFLPEVSNKPITFTEGRSCIKCGRNYPMPTPGMFSFNSPHGACPDCRGFGDIITYDINKIIPDKNKSFNGGAIPVLELNRFSYMKYYIEDLMKRKGISRDIPFSFLSKNDFEIIWRGKGENEGLIGFFKNIEKKRYRVDIRAILAKYRSYLKCPKCNGSRLCSDAMNVKVGDLDIGKVVNIPFSLLMNFFIAMKSSYKENKVASDILEQITRRLKLLVNVGVGYLTLNRMTRTLSRGELQRINLINAAGADLTGSLYLMDEPSVGLHPMDEVGLIEVIRELKEKGNTVIVAEHSPSLIKMADYIIELGPKAGEEGGNVVFSGKKDEFLLAGTITSAYVGGNRVLDTPKFRRTGNGQFIKIKGATAHNLKKINIDFPVGVFSCLTGPSGAGKSSLMMDIIYGNWRKNYKKDYAFQAGDCSSIEGLDIFEDVIPIEGGKTASSPRSCVVTYIGVFSEIRKHFAELRTSRAAGLESKNFSFNTKEGRCPDCEGRGMIVVDLQFLPDVSIVCERCRGTRYREAPLNHRFLGLNMSDVLELTVEKALDVFKSKDRIIAKLRLLDDIGLGYLKLGQPLDTLSSGETSRLSLARIIGKKEIKNRLFLFDEPSIGLHPFNVSRLIKIFTRMLANNATIICIEHNLEIIKSADFIIDMGPGGGDNGGRILATGTPEEIAVNELSVTGKYLDECLNNRQEESVGQTIYNGYQITR
jgi:excinuclease ABC subunit A